MSRSRAVNGSRFCKSLMLIVLGFAENLLATGYPHRIRSLEFPSGKTEGDMILLAWVDCQVMLFALLPSSS
jgi:hypothetical protein